MRGAWGCGEGEEDVGDSMRTREAYGEGLLRLDVVFVV